MLASMWGPPHEGLLPRATHTDIKPDMLSWRLDSSSFFGSEMPLYSTCSRLSYSRRLLIDPSTSSRTLGVIQPLRVNTQEAHRVWLRSLHWTFVVEVRPSYAYCSTESALANNYVRYVHVISTFLEGIAEMAAKQRPLFNKYFWRDGRTFSSRLRQQNQIFDKMTWHLPVMPMAPNLDILNETSGHFPADLFLTKWFLCLKPNQTMSTTFLKYEFRRELIPGAPKKDTTHRWFCRLGCIKSSSIQASHIVPLHAVLYMLIKVK